MQEDTLYRLECLVDKALLDDLRELAATQGTSFPSVISRVLRLGTNEAKILGLEGGYEVLGGFVQWVLSTRPRATPHPTVMAELLQEMFLLWTPARQRDFEKHLKRVDDPEEWRKRRRTLDFWFDYCNVRGISATLLVDDGARW